MTYDVRCVTVSRTDYASIHVCSILEDGKEVDTVNFRVVRRAGRKELLPEGGREFEEAFYRVFGRMDTTPLIRGRTAKLNRTLEWMVKKVLESGLWKPKTKQPIKV